MISRNKQRTKRKIRIRKKVVGTAQVPRVSVFRSNKNIYAQLIDDANGVTLASASTQEKGNKTPAISSVKQGEDVGKRLSEKAKAIKVEKVVFDRSGYKYHGAVAALAQAMRDNGIKL